MEKIFTKDKPNEVSRMLMLVIGWISALVSLVKIPFAFGTLAIVLGIFCTKGGSRSGVILIAVSILCLSVGLMFNEVFYNYLSRAFGI